MNEMLNSTIACFIYKKEIPYVLCGFLEWCYAYLVRYVFKKRTLRELRHRGHRRIEDIVAL